MLQKMLVILLLLLVSLKVKAAPIANGTETVVLTKSELVSIMTGRRTLWPNGTRIVVFVLPRDHQATREFLEMLGIPIGIYFDNLSSQYSTGKANVPQILDTEFKMVLKVNSTMGSIGYVSYSRLVENAPHVRLVILEQ